MSLIISGIRASIDLLEQEVISKVLKENNLLKYEKDAYIYKKSVDLRRNVSFVYSVAINAPEYEREIAKKFKENQYKIIAPPKELIKSGDKKLNRRPIIVGLGPAGLFCGYILAKHGYNPLIIERGKEVDRRDIDVQNFFNMQKLDTESNIQFGEGGAGTYSDGKLTTRIGDERCEIVLRTLVEHGAPKEILKLAKPHVGTDILKKVVVSMREDILKCGGEILFSHKLEGISHKNGKLKSVVVNGQDIECELLVLALGHSARDTFMSLHEDGLFIEPKPFSIGARIEHLQDDINKMMYGKYCGHRNLQNAEYALSHREDGRACYSFCMCPGGFVVAASSEENMVVTNGMSNYKRDGKNANSAIAVSVSPEDFYDGTPFGGVALQRKCEHEAFLKFGKDYKAPVQNVTDFLNGQKTKKPVISPTFPTGVVPGDISECLPNYVNDMLKIGLRKFENNIKGFTKNKAILTAPETRTSSPIRIVRNENFMSTKIEGVMPCGEGAGYAGGIMSAAVDGLKVSEWILQEYDNLHISR